MSSRHSNSTLLTIFVFINHSLWCKLKVYIMTHAKDKRNHLRQIDIVDSFAKLVGQ